MSARRRLDQVMVERGLTRSRSRARDLIKRGVVTVDGAQMTKAGGLVASAQVVEVANGADRFVARSGHKLDEALQEFSFSAEGLACLDVGASTGGFTQVLLRDGARKVYAVDVGVDQLEESVREDPRVVDLAGINARELTVDTIGVRVQAIVVDISFISVLKVLPSVLTLAAPRCWMVLLIKPQFEVGREGIGKGGLVSDPAQAQRAIDDIDGFLKLRGWHVVGVLPASLRGKGGNQEYVMGTVLHG